ncbi:copper chaperone PCu(A)C [Primorskyibacter sp. S187A]|uniref:copper chaperone PCu(A)C n=1 Tax=Primorskyibacter sp. S187A TaxID=3415130 RepID=UPI003C7D8320
MIHGTTRAAALIGALALAGPALAHEFNIGGLFVEHPYAPPTQAGATSAIGMLTIRNQTDETEKLTDIRGPFDTVTLRHRVEVGDEMRLVPVDRLAIPRGGSVTLTAEALHVFFDGLAEDGFAKGDRIPTTFVFQNAGEMEVIFVVETDAEQ